MENKEYIERGALLDKLNNKVKLDYEMGLYNHGALTESFIRFVERQPAADVVELDDIRKAFNNYILEMTCSKYGTPSETKFARDIVMQAVNIVLGERK